MKTKLTFTKLTPRHAKLIIPKGLYCYDENGICPFWGKIHSLPHQSSGYCHWMQEGDQESEGATLLWDQCKECGINTED